MAGREKAGRTLHRENTDNQINVAVQHINKAAAARSYSVGAGGLNQVPETIQLVVVTVTKTGAGFNDCVEYIEIAVLVFLYLK